MTEHSGSQTRQAPVALERQASSVALIVILSLALVLIGLVMVASTTMLPNADGRAFGFLTGRFIRQAIFAAMALVGMGIIAVASPRWFFGGEGWRRTFVLALAACTLLCLVLVLVPSLASIRNGSQRWLAVGPAHWAIGFQPSELSKLALVFVLAWWLGREGADARSLRTGFLPAAAILGTFVALVGVEDFGTAALLGLVGGLVLLAAGSRWLHLTSLGLLASGGFAALLFMEEYRLKRLTAFLDPHADPLGAGYHPLQSLRTIASGGWFGVGLGNGVQKHGYLPESETDFIFSVICEEAGVIGGMLVIVLFIALVWVGLRIAARARTRFEYLLAFAITALFGTQAAMNVAVATVAAPTTGIPLPLISAGGSGLVVYGVALGILLAIARRGIVPVAASSAAVIDRESAEGYALIAGGR